MSNKNIKNEALIGGSELNAGLGLFLLPRIEAHIRQLSPHMMQREGVVLLREARDEIKRLKEESERLHISATQGLGVT